jgi:PhnB protein
MKETSQTRPDPSVMKGVIPYLNLRGRAAEAMEFYARAFGAKDLGRMPSETPPRMMHCQVEINGGAFMMCDHEEGERGPMQDMHLQLVVGDGQAWWDRAIGAGCEEVAPFKTQFWGDTWGMVRDPFGLLWAILEPGQAG